MPSPIGCWTVIPGGIQGVGISPRGLDYPFVLPPPSDRGILADAHLSYDFNAPLPLRVAWLLGFDRAVNCGDPGPTPDIGSPAAVNDVDVIIVDADNATLFDSRVADSYLWTLDAPGLISHEWRTATAACRIVQRTYAESDAAAQILPSAWQPSSGILDARCCERRADRLDLVTVTGDGSFGGQLALVGGYNVTLVPTSLTRGLKRVTRLAISATPGDGLGLAPGCTPTPEFLRSINTVKAANGAFQLAAEDCYWTRQPVVASVPTAGTLEIGNDCGPCCECDDFESVQRGVLRTWDRYEEIAYALKIVVTEYESNMARWSAQKSCRESKSTRVNALPHTPNVEIAASICNATDKCKHNAKLEVTIEVTPTTTFSVVAHSGTITDGFGGLRSYVPMRVGDTISAHWDLLPPQAAVALRFRIRLDIADGDTVAVKITAKAYVNDEPLPGIAVRNVTVSP